ncbi:MAG: hypothetical protein HY711_07420 [Candidatus Melainabacteria bacterium]|nr:hypothetical protein [Candidatus Melainabacteria bacterium]
MAISLAPAPTTTKEPVKDNCTKGPSFWGQLMIALVGSTTSSTPVGKGSTSKTDLSRLRAMREQYERVQEDQLRTSGTRRVVCDNRLRERLKPLLKRQRVYAPRQLLARQIAIFAYQL